MKHISSLYIFTIISTFSATALGQDAAKSIYDETVQVHQMQQQLDAHRLVGFLELAKDTRWTTPKIHSKYWVERLSINLSDIIVLEKAKRTLGLSIARQLDVEATEIAEPANSERRENQARRLLDVAEWMRGSPGYGNLMLTIRAENLAYVPIGYLVADTSFPTNKITKLMQQIRSPQSALQFQIDVLNDEAPEAINIRLTGDTISDTRRLQEEWFKNMKLVSAWCRDNNVYPNQAYKHRDKMPSQCAFYVDDGFTKPPYTSVNRWDEKQHQSICVYGGVKDVRPGVDALFLFRLKAGDFPTTPPKWFDQNEKIYTPVQAAFVQAFEPYRNEYGPLGDLAGSVYESIKAQKFVDWETSQLQEALIQSNGARQPQGH